MSELLNRDDDLEERRLLLKERFFQLDSEERSKDNTDRK